MLCSSLESLFAALSVAALSSLILRDKHGRRHAPLKLLMRHFSSFEVFDQEDYNRARLFHGETAPSCGCDHRSEPVDATSEDQLQNLCTFPNLSRRIEKGWPARKSCFQLSKEDHHGAALCRKQQRQPGPLCQPGGWFQDQEKAISSALHVCHSHFLGLFHCHHNLPPTTAPR